MNGRERVRAALRREEADRAPIDFGSNYNTSVSVFAYNKLKKHLGVTSPTYVRDVVPMLASMDLEENLEIPLMLGTDLVALPRKFYNGMPDRDWKEWVLRDGSACMVPGRFNPVEREDGALELVYGGKPLLRMPAGGYYFDVVANSMAHVETAAQMEEAMKEQAGRGYLRVTDAELKASAARARELREKYGLAVVGDPFPSSFYQAGQEALGYEKFFNYLITKKDVIHTWMELNTQNLEERVTKYLDALAPYIDVIIFGDDLGSQQAPQISPQMFAEVIKPYMTRVFSLIHDRWPDVFILLHSCGSIAPLIPHFIEAGVDALNPVQTTAKNMDAAMLKREFGRDITFWGGGVGTQTTLVNGTLEDIRAEVKQNMEIFKPGGGYIFCPNHDLQEHVTPEQILAIYETAKAHRDY